MPCDLRNTVVCGDCMAYAPQFPDESIDLIFCDPVYWEVDQYQWLASFGSRTLRPGGNLICQVGQLFLPKIFAAMTDKGLEWCWIIKEDFTGGYNSIWKGRISNSWKPYLWWTKGSPMERRGNWLMDSIRGGGRLKTGHIWQDSPAAYRAILSRLTKPDDVVWDGFTGSGTVPAVCVELAVNYIAFDTDMVNVVYARERVALARPDMLSEWRQEELLHGQA